VDVQAGAYIGSVAACSGESSWEGFLRLLLSRVPLARAVAWVMVARRDTDDPITSNIFKTVLGLSLLVLSIFYGLVVAFAAA